VFETRGGGKRGRCPERGEKIPSNKSTLKCEGWQHGARKQCVERGFESNCRTNLGGARKTGVVVVAERGGGLKKTSLGKES